eukprot:jgi/Chrpa1/35/Chrysochromulina_OHIO_Genome00000078-RA
MALRARLEAAQHSITASEARRRAAVEATATAQAQLAEKHRVLRATRERLCDLAENVSEALEATLASDPEVAREEETLFMLRARLRCAQEAVAKHRMRRDEMKANLDLMRRVAALAPTTARRPSSAAPAIGGSDHSGRRATPASTRLNEDGLQAMMKRLVPSKHELARRPGLHPNSRRLFGEQGVEAPPDPPGTAPPANPDAPKKPPKVRREDLIQHLYEGPMQRLKELQKKQEQERQPSPSAVMSQERLAGMMKRLHDAPAASKRRALARERTDAQAAEAVGARTLNKGASVVGDRPRDTPQYELTVPEGYRACEDLPVVLPDGRSILVAIPDGLGPGDDFVALLPRAGPL